MYRPIIMYEEILGYDKVKFIGIPHNILKHPDRPKAIFYLVWQGLLSGRPISGVVKNLAKDGHYYWVIVDFKPKLDTYGNIISLTAIRRV
ncbi:MAG: PAS domain-containing protein, partial [Sulfurovaceae bacterium]|nr:PAS domain-containing protein [Sulfurovaceae bacterium]